MAAGIADVDQVELTTERTFTARRILVEAALLGILADGALRNAPDGLGWTLWVLALALVALNVARSRGLAVTREQMAWLGAAVACATAFAWRDAEQLRAFNVLGTLVAFTMFAMCATGRPAATIFATRVRDVAAAGLYTIRDIVGGAPVLALFDAQLHRVSFVRRGASWTALRAVLITAPLFLVFVLLLSRADPVFASIFRLPQLDIEELVSHVAIIGAFGWWSAGYVRGALLGVSRRPALPEIPFRFGTAEITTSLGAVIALFAIFVTLQLRWLFGGADVVLATTGLTVAEYARRGFFELVAVAALVVPLILGTRAVIEDEKVVRRHRALSLALIILLAPIIASALLRMQLYVSYFGLTTDRLYATALMIWLGIVFVFMTGTVLRGWTRPFAAMTMLSAFAALFTLNMINPDLLVARVNLGRATAERTVDYQYLARLGGDAVPTVAKALAATSQSVESCKAAELLRNRWLGDRAAGWNLGARRAGEAVVAYLPPAMVSRLCGGMFNSSQGVPKQ